jgi:hypothetical protein
MPDLPDSTPPPVLPPPSATVAAWERHEGFRTTFLIHFPLEHQEALQRVAQLLFDTALEKRPSDDWPQLPGPWTEWELVVALAEMRILEGFLRSVFDEQTVSSLPAHVEKLCSIAAGASLALAEVSRTLEGDLTAWRRKHGSK